MKLLLAADLVPTSVTEKYFEDADVRTLFGDVCYEAKKADRFIVNLECALTHSDGAIKKFGPNIKCTPECVNAIKKLGVTDVCLTNNHVFDCGIKGLRDTMAALDGAGLPYTGIGENDTDSRKIYYIENGDKKISIVNVCEHEYTDALPNRIGVNPFDPYLTMQDIREAKKNSDYLIVIYHGGKEYCRYPSPRIVKMCHEMVYNGADVVLLQHTHCIGCYEQFEGAHIVYGQGNLHFASLTPDAYPVWYTSIMVEVDFKGEHPTIKFYPLTLVNEAVHLSEGDEAKEIMDAFYARNEEMKNGKWLDGWRDFCHNSPYNYNYKWAIDIYNDPDAPNNPRYREPLKHYLDTETHVDVMWELFKTANHTNK